MQLKKATITFFFNISVLLNQKHKTLGLGSHHFFSSRTERSVIVAPFCDSKGNQMFLEQIFLLNFFLSNFLEKSRHNIAGFGCDFAPQQAFFVYGSHLSNAVIGCTCLSSVDYLVAAGLLILFISYFGYFYNYCRYYYSYFFQTPTK